MQNDQLNDEQLDQVSGGLEVVKLGKITVVGKRDEPLQVAKLDKVTVTEKKSNS